MYVPLDSAPSHLGITSTDTFLCAATTQAEVRPTGSSVEVHPELRERQEISVSLYVVSYRNDLLNAVFVLFFETMIKRKHKHETEMVPRKNLYGPRLHPVPKRIIFLFPYCIVG